MNKKIILKQIFQPIFKLSFNARGSVLLLALLVLSVIMLGSVALSSIVMSGIRQARTLDNAIVAYYAAESGVEESLYRLRKEEATALELAGGSGNLANDASWNIGQYGLPDDPDAGISDKESQINIVKLPQNQFIELNLYDPEPTSPEIASLRLRASPGQGFEVLQIEWFGWSSNGELSNIQNKRIFHSLFSDEDGSALNLRELNPAGSYDAYQVKIKALYGDVDNLEITAHTDIAGDPQAVTPIPSRLLAKVEGQYRGTRQTLKYAMSRKSPLSGLFGFVLFSECSILKGVTEECQ